MKLAPIKMENLGSDSPLSMAELAGKVLVAIAAGVAKQGTDLIPPDLRNGIESGLSGTGKFLQQGVKGVFETGKGVGEGILNIFGKKPKDANQSN
jgi:hypothetical protein